MLGVGRKWQACAGFTLGSGQVGGRGMAGLCCLHCRPSLCKGEVGCDFMLRSL